MNYTIIGGKIISSSYVLDMFNYIEKAQEDDISPDDVRKVLFDEFEKLVLQGKITFGFVYTENKENELRGRIGNFSGFRTGTQFLKLIPANKRPKSRSTEETCLRYYDFGRMAWRSFKKTLFVVASSFFNDKDGKWYDTPEAAGFTSNWKNINSKYKRSERKDTKAEALKRAKIEDKEIDKRNTQIAKQQKKRYKIKNGKIGIE